MRWSLDQNQDNLTNVWKNQMQIGNAARFRNDKQSHEIILLQVNSVLLGSLIDIMDEHWNLWDTYYSSFFALNRHLPNEQSSNSSNWCSFWSMMVIYQKKLQTIQIWWQRRVPQCLSSKTDIFEEIDYDRR